MMGEQKSNIGAIERYERKRYKSDPTTTSLKAQDILAGGRQINYTEKFATSVSFKTVDSASKKWLPGLTLFSVNNSMYQTNLIDREQFSKIVDVSATNQLNERFKMKAESMVKNATEKAHSEMMTDIGRVMQTKMNYEVDSNGTALDLNDMDVVQDVLGIVGTVGERITPLVPEGVNSFGPIYANLDSSENITSIVHRGSVQTTNQWGNKTMQHGERLSFLIKKVSPLNLPDPYTANARKVFNKMVSTLNPKNEHQRNFDFVTFVCIIPITRESSSDPIQTCSYRESHSKKDENGDLQFDDYTYLSQPPLENINYKEWRVGKDGLLYINQEGLPEYTLRSGYLLDVGYVDKPYFGDTFTDNQETTVEMLDMPKISEILKQPLLEMVVSPTVVLYS